MISKISTNLESLNIRADAGFFKAALKSHLNAGNMESVTKILNQAASSKNCAILDVTTEWYSPFISKFWKQGNISEIMKIKDQVANSSITWEVSYCNTMANVLAKLPDSTKNLRTLFSTMKAKGVKPNDCTYRVVKTCNISAIFDEVFNPNTAKSKCDLTDLLLDDFVKF